MPLVILDLCGGTGAWSLPYKQAGYDVRSVSLPAQDVRCYTPPTAVHGILAAPPCTEFAASGARWWKDKDPCLLEEALGVFDACKAIIRESRPAWWVLENPVGRLRRLRPELGKPTLVYHPWEYGDPYTKQTLLWGEFQEPVRSPVVPAGSRQGQPNAWYSSVGGSSEATKRFRSRTPPRFARAFFLANP